MMETKGAALEDTPGGREDQQQAESNNRSHPEAFGSGAGGGGNLHGDDLPGADVGGSRAKKPTTGKPPSLLSGETAAEAQRQRQETADTAAAAAGASSSAASSSSSPTEGQPYQTYFHKAPTSLFQNDTTHVHNHIVVDRDYHRQSNHHHHATSDDDAMMMSIRSSPLLASGSIGRRGTASEQVDQRDVTATPPPARDRQRWQQQQQQHGRNHNIHLDEGDDVPHHPHQGTFSPFANSFDSLSEAGGPYSFSMMENQMMLSSPPPPLATATTTTATAATFAATGVAGRGESGDNFTNNVVRGVGGGRIGGAYSTTFNSNGPTIGRGGGGGGQAGRTIDIALPDLKHHASADDSSSYSLGDISPIKMIYNNNDNSSNTKNGRGPSPPSSINAHHRRSSLEDSFVNMDASLSHQHHHYQSGDRGGGGGGYDLTSTATTWEKATDATSGRALQGQDGFLVPEHGSGDGIGSGCDGDIGGAGHISNPFFVMRSAREAFEECKYVLPCLREEDVCPVNVSTYGHINHYRGQEMSTRALSVDAKIATRRVETAICAFGGTLNSRRRNDASSIFRLSRGGEKQMYERCLPSRYNLGGSVISWDVEENPPVHLDSEKNQHRVGGGATAKDGGRTTSPGGDSSQHDTDPVGRNGSSPTVGTSQASDEAKKMKYRCKLCGQLKQNHDCPYRQSLHRSIGVMVYPSVNAFTAAEPGTVAPSLTKMNNFVSYDSSKSEPTYTSVGPTVKHSSHSHLHPSTVTPATGCYYSPQSSLSNHSDEASISREHGHCGKKQKRSHPDQLSDARTQPAVFVASVNLRPEHYRAVDDPTKSNAQAYQYPAIPLTFAERKRLSDTLFHLSKEIPSLTADCALLLREARKNAEWDLAVAELLTQVVVGLYCGEGDTSLEGLSQYLLTLGISC